MWVVPGAFFGNKLTVRQCFMNLTPRPPLAEQPFEELLH
jgi:hypothetical protein